MTYNWNDDSIYALWIRSDTIYDNYALSPYTSGSWMGTPYVWKTGTNLRNLSAQYAGASSTQIFAEWTSDSSAPYTVNWAIVTVPENLLIFLMAGPVLPFLLKRKKKREAAIVCRI
jgi:hypothetical protein